MGRGAARPRQEFSTMRLKLVGGYALQVLTIRTDRRLDEMDQQVWSIWSRWCRVWV